MRFKILFLFILTLSSCSPKLYYHYRYDKMFFDKNNIKRVVIASMPSQLPEGVTNDKYLKELMNEIKLYVQTNNYEIVSETLIEDYYKKIIDKTGGYYDSRTGAIDVNKKNMIMNQFYEMIKEDNICDIIIYPRILVRPAENEFKSAKWDGVSRNLYLYGPRNIVRDGRWSGDSRALSLNITIYNLEDQLVFENNGGIDLLTKNEYNEFKKVWEVKYRKSPLQNTSYFNGAIKIAFHPFIHYEDYPVSANFYKN